MEFTENIKSSVIRLVQPGQFETIAVNRICHNGEVVIEPELISICHADLRYFSGTRRKEVLQEKLPMALFHEGIGRVVKSRSDSISIGDRVAIVPNLARFRLNRISKEECCTVCRFTETENYCENGVFLGSGYDGLAQSRIVLPAHNVVEIPDNIPDNIAVLAELASVSMQAITRVDAYRLKTGKVAVFGDGPVGYITASLLHHKFRVPKDNLVVFGAQPEKLSHFSFATTHLVNNYDFSRQQNILTVFECTGGHFSESSINQAIEVCERLSEIVLLGVSENFVPINTRDMLEKGLKLMGTSRSERSDFLKVVKAMKDKELQKTLMKISSDTTISIRTENHLTEVMDQVMKEKGWTKTNLSIVWE